MPLGSPVLPEVNCTSSNPPTALGGRRDALAQLGEREVARRRPATGPRSRPRRGRAGGRSARGGGGARRRPWPAACRAASRGARRRAPSPTRKASPSHEVSSTVPSGRSARPRRDRSPATRRAGLEQLVARGDRRAPGQIWIVRWPSPSTSAAASEASSTAQLGSTGSQLGDGLRRADRVGVAVGGDVALGADAVGDRHVAHRPPARAGRRPGRPAARPRGRHRRARAGPPPRRPAASRRPPEG